MHGNEMQIRDIVNRDIVNLQNCENEPIHIPGSIQPHGILLALNPNSYVIEYCSSNVSNYFDILPAKVLNKPLHSLLGDEQAGKIIDYVNANLSFEAHPHVVNHNGTAYNTIIYKCNNLLVLELEPFPDGGLALPDLYTQTSRFVNFLQHASSLVELCQNVADEIKSITGYDRVMVYRFDKEYNGEVIAEAVNNNLEPFLGLNYPHTDIPAQARQLYLSNLLRMIVDVNYQPVPIVTLQQSADNTHIDLSKSVLRSVSPIHIQYLQNMGVGGTLTISLIHDKKLWGLIACHHYSPKHVPYYTRLAALLQGHFLTSQIKVREVAEDYTLAQVIDDRLQQLLKKIGKGNVRMVEQEHLEQIQRLANADGVAIIINSKIYTAGEVPSTADITSLSDWLHTNSVLGQYKTSCLSAEYEGGKEITDVAAGIVFQSLGTVDKDSIIWFRQEVEKSINWAGDPTKAIEKDEKGLSPRKSFALWKETVKFNSIDWNRAELNAATVFASALQKQLHVYYLTAQENKYRTLSEKLQVANNELANINWISTHDLKEPLRKIRIFASRVLAEDINDSVRDSVTRMQNSAIRMQSLIEDILSYSKLGNMQSAFVRVDVSAMLHEIKNELYEELSERNVSLSIDNLCEANGIPFQLHQLFTNLISNAIKFSKPGNAATISVTCHEVSGSGIADLVPGNEYYRITVADNGIGFDAAHNESIFQLFKRLNAANDYTGTGIGLAICKKIAENHNGTIVALGKHNVGATFHVYLPKV
jgi:light-regulated signal transduction histidine kinase (bacteriophytochrome)